MYITWKIIESDEFPKKISLAQSILLEMLYSGINNFIKMEVKNIKISMGTKKLAI